MSDSPAHSGSSPHFDTPDSADGWLGQAVVWAVDTAAGRLPVPEDVLDIAACQGASLVAAAVSGGRLAPVRAMVEVLAEESRAEGDTKVLLSMAGSCYTFRNQLTANAVASMAQDYDDFLWMGHCGHSTIWASILPLPAGVVSPAYDWRRLAVVGNELGGRLGAACVLGPQNGQMWNFVHRLAGAVIFGIRCGADVTTILRAVRLALYQANAPVYQGFFASDAKLLTAAEPLVAAWQAIRLAGAGWQAEGPHLEGDGGFLERFAFLPLPGMLEGLGKSWVTRTMVLKTAPACAYLIPAIEGLERINQRYTDQHHQRLAPEEVVLVTVRCSLLTLFMDRMADRAMARTERIHPVAVNCSVRWSLAVALLAGTLDGRVLTREYLADNEDVLAVLAERVRVVHDGRLSWQVIQALRRALPVKYWLHGVAFWRLLPAIRQMRRSTSVRIALWRVGWDMLRTARPLRRWWRWPARWWRRRSEERRTGEGLARADFGRPVLRFPVHMEIVCRDGSRWHSKVGWSKGTAGLPGFEEAARKKWITEVGDGYTELYEELVSDPMLDTTRWYQTLLARLQENED